MGNPSKLTNRPHVFFPKLFPRVLKIFVNLYQLDTVWLFMIQISIFLNCNGDIGDYDVIKPENSTLRVSPLLP